MIIVDRSVWIDYFIGNKTPEVEKLDRLLGRHPIGTSELIYTDVLSAVDDDRDFQSVVRLFALLTEVNMLSPRIALRAAEHTRKLRALGIVIPNTLDALIATCCMENDYPLLYSRKSYRHFEDRISLRNAMTLD